MTSIAKRFATEVDIADLPENVVGEIIDGDLVVSPRPGGPHARAASVAGMVIGNPYDLGHGGPGGWWILFEPELHFTPNIVVPDIAGWRRERMPEIPSDHRFRVAPDWVCEVISPSSASTDRIRKLRIYARAGVQYAWIIDPLSTSLEVYRNVNDTWSLVQGFSAEEGDKLVRAEPFADIELDLTAMWQRSQA